MPTSGAVVDGIGGIAAVGLDLPEGDQSALVRGARVNTRDLRWMEPTDPKVAPTSFTIILHNYIQLKAYINYYNTTLSITTSVTFNCSDLTSFYRQSGCAEKIRFEVGGSLRMIGAIPR
jgi:hypothetical protein